MIQTEKWKPSPSQEAHLENLFVQLDTPRAGRAFVRHAIEQSPCRPVSNRRGNVTFKYVSRKNDRVLELESRSGEYPQAVLLENDPEVVMWLCQAPKVTLDLKDKHGTRTGIAGYHLDFLVIYRDKIVGIEVRDESALHRQYLDNPHQFWFDGEADRWHYRAAEEHFAALGLELRIYANRQLNSVYVNNLKFLEDFMVKDDGPANELEAQRLKHRLAEAKRLGYLQALREGFSADHMFRAVARGDVFVDLKTDRLDQVQTLSLYSNSSVREVYRLQEAAALEPIQPIPGTMFLRAGARIEYGGRAYHVVICGERDVEVRDEHGRGHTLDLVVLQDMHSAGKLIVDGCMPGEGPRELAHCSEQELANALRRLNALRNSDTSQYSQRSLSRFASLTRGITGELAQLLALVDESASRGNREPRYSERDEEMVKKAIEQKYNKPEACTKKSAYEHYNSLCDQADIDEADELPIRRVSFTTFCRRVDELKDTRARHGKRVAYQRGPIVSTTNDPYPVHGVMAHEICYIDHTNVNLALVAGDATRTPLHKPWISVAQDGCTTQARALIMTFAPPSTTTVLLVLRDYVRRNKRLPKILSLDNAKEFKGKGLQSFCQLYGVHLRFRAPGQPRGGAPIESLQGAIETEVVSQLAGNTIQMKDPRLVTKSVNGFNHAEHTLTSAFSIIEQYLFVTRENRIHPVLGVTPAEYEKQRNELTGERQHIHIRYDENLLLATSPFARRVHHVVCPRRGVWVDNMWYRHAMLRGHKKGTKVRVRTEPFAARVAYVEVKGRWYAAVGSNSRDLDGRTTREVEIASRAKLKAAGVQARAERLRGKTDDGSPRGLKPEDFDVRLSLQEAEAKYLLNSCGLLGAMVPDEKTLNGEGAFDFLRGPSMLPEREGPQGTLASVAAPQLGFNANLFPASCLDPLVMVSESARSGKTNVPAASPRRGFF